METSSSAIARTNMVPVTARPSGVVLKYCLPRGTDVESPTGDRRQAFLDERPGAVDKSRSLGAVSPGSARDRRDVRLVVLANVSGVGVRDGSLFPHPGHSDRCVQTAGERDSYPFTDRKLCENFGHVAQPRTLRRVLLRAEHRQPGVLGGHHGFRERSSPQAGFPHELHR